MLILSECLTYGAADYLFIPHGPYWRFMKKLCMTELLGGRTPEKFMSIRQDEIGEFLTSVLQASYSKKPVEIRQELVKFTSNIISRMTMGKSSETDDQVVGLRSAARETGEFLGATNLGDFMGFLKPLDIQGIGKKMKKLHQKMDAVMEEVIREHEEAKMKMGDSGDRMSKDLFDILIDLTAADNTETKLSRESAKAFALVTQFL